MQKSLAPFVLIGILLSACSTTVIEDSERELPAPTTKVMEEGSPPSFDVDYLQSFIAFKGNKGGIIHHKGKFEDFDLEITVDPKNPTDSTLAKAEVSIGIKSMVTDSDGLTKHLLSADFFEAEKFPNATFVTTSVTPSGEDQS
ncbi:MAG: YceI family protein [Candidatus Peribacteraceae bacterium]|jgi:polyisoprenoid-binding protein YceI|nr:YceI family protein [Candidatus Peribacteraceae bacterium]MDP7454654.1 YceI family protein [Candidatus Peribacteraceae bacterium]MDP7646301.1 YceI family protein [Candidatus Peribacteraceae bacterium]|tara:strand:+ start:130 stop:558 length:429 start_codon:yes stop_codon:yes gene_type:complete